MIPSWVGAASLMVNVFWFVLLLATRRAYLNMKAKFETAEMERQIIVAAHTALKHTRQQMVIPAPVRRGYITDVHEVVAKVTLDPYNGQPPAWSTGGPSSAADFVVNAVRLVGQPINRVLVLGGIFYWDLSVPLPSDGWKKLDPVPSHSAHDRPFFEFRSGSWSVDDPPVVIEVQAKVREPAR
jgi:hypothetical protein